METLGWWVFRLFVLFLTCILYCACSICAMLIWDVKLNPNANANNINIPFFLLPLIYILNITWTHFTSCLQGGFFILQFGVINVCVCYFFCMLVMRSVCMLFNLYKQISYFKKKNKTKRDPIIFLYIAVAENEGGLFNVRISWATLGILYDFRLNNVDTRKCKIARPEYLYSYQVGDGSGTIVWWKFSSQIHNHAVAYWWKCTPNKGKWIINYERNLV